LSPPEHREAITPLRVAEVAWRRKLVCSVVAIVVFLGGTGFLLTRPKAYQSTSSVALLPVSTNANILPNYPNLIQSLIPTYIQLVSSPVLLNQVAATLPFAISGTQLANDVHAQSMSSAAIINIVADNPNAVHAQEIASRATTVFLAELAGNGVVIPRVYGQPTVPGAPQTPNIKLLLAVILLLALILGLGAGLVWDRLFSSADAPGDPPQIAGAGNPPEIAGPPVLGVVFEAAERRDVNSILASRYTAASTDRWRAIRTNFMYATIGQEVRSVTVTSLRPDEGKTTVAVILAASLAELGLSVVLVDAAVVRPALHEVFGLDNGQGLTSTVLDGATPASLLRPVPQIPGVQVITAGPPHLPAPGDAGSLCAQQLPRFSAVADFVVVDGPVLGEDDGADMAANATDAAVLVVSSPPGQPGPALRILERCDTRVVGTVLTARDEAVSRGKPGRGLDGDRQEELDDRRQEEYESRAGTPGLQQDAG
jgi:Mrp family chromosome partitioning ATPase/capsular polysaccharide biosynthesis protein